jgi:hypothetical protein
MFCIRFSFFVQKSRELLADSSAQIWLVFTSVPAGAGSNIPESPLRPGLAGRTPQDVSGKHY